MDLTFQVPMQYCFLKHRTLLFSVTSTTGCCFCFGSVSSFFLELFLHWSPVAFWAPTDLGSSSFSVVSFCLFILFMVFSRQESEVVCCSLLQWTMFCQNSQLWLIFIVQQKPTQPCNAIILLFKIKQNKIKNTSKHKHSNKIWKQPFLLSISIFVQHHWSSEAFQVEYWLSALAIVCLSNQSVIPPRHFCGLLSHLILVFV